ncbi:Mobile element protein [Collimonas arenae]|uniref:Mobile element protein n=1 Tax=Collimonas arenae TaxID=279058 RepID=A0A0A1FAY5_9BURK|nr:transposase [Collimonas arenae]AIY41681.1 Mobile element protein [Collimonas arenae]
MNQIQEYELKLGDEQWSQLEPILIGRPGGPGMCAKDNRLFIEAILWVVSNKALWHSVPPQFGKWNATYMRFRRWTESNFWRFLLQSRIQDPDLLRMLTEIADYADLYSQRREWRLYRRNHKKLYAREIA